MDDDLNDPEFDLLHALEGTEEDPEESRNDKAVRITSEADSLIPDSLSASDRQKSDSALADSKGVEISVLIAVFFLLHISTC